MFLTLFVYYSADPVAIAVYKKVDNKVYTLKDISQIDNINLPFKNDGKALGLWQTVDFIPIKAKFIPGTKQSKYNTPLLSLSFLPNGKMIVSWADNSLGNQTWTKGYALFCRGGREDVACHYDIQNIDGKDYIYLEWKSGDYTFGNRITHKYVLEKIS